MVAGATFLQAALYTGMLLVFKHCSHFARPGCPVAISQQGIMAFWASKIPLSAATRLLLGEQSLRLAGERDSGYATAEEKLEKG